VRDERIALAGEAPEIAPRCPERLRASVVGLGSGLLGVQVAGDTVIVEIASRERGELVSRSLSSMSAETRGAQR